MYFGWKKKTSYKYRYSILLIDWIVFGVCVGVVGLGSMVSVVLTSDLEQKIAIVQEIGIAISGVDMNISALLRGIDKWYSSIDGTQQTDTQGGIVTLHSSLALAEKYFPQSLLGEIAMYHSDTFKDLLGANGSQSYLILLQNTNEARPNGGFFGSYIHMTFSEGILSSLEFRDSYLPGFDRPGVGIQGPPRLLNMMPTNEIHFVGANKIGFTYADGGHIKNLYELAYPNETIRGVVFLRLDNLISVLPEIEDTVTRWQFINAMANELPRSGREKKSLYLASIQDIFKDALISIVSEIPNQNEYTKIIDVYLEEIPGEFHSFLKNNALTTRFDSDTLYAWNSNISFSKTDGFVEKNVMCKPIQCLGEECSTFQGIERIEFDELLGTDELVCTKSYEFSIPEKYFETIASLEEEYGVSLGSREEHILGITKTRGTRGVIYLGDQWEISGLTGDIYEGGVFPTPFGQGITYKIRMDDEGEGTVSWTMKRKAPLSLSK